MAGRPKKQAIAQYLTAQAQLDDCTPLEWVEQWIESGKTITELADTISGVAGLTIERGQLSRVVNALEPGAEERLTNARTRGGHALVELNVADTEALSVSEDSALVQRQKELNAQRSRLAGVWNRELADQKGTQVSISIGTLHLDALRRANSATAVIANPPSEPVIDVQVEELPALAPGSSSGGDSEVTG